MSVFSRVVPLVAVYKPTGKEKKVTGILVTELVQYGVAVHVNESDNIYFLDLTSVGEVSVGDEFPTGRIVEFRKHYYKSAEDYNNGVLTPEDEIIVRVIPD